MTVDWGAIGAISDVLGALFVGVTLIYLAVQLHQNTRASRMEALNTAIGNHVMQIASLTSTIEKASLFRRFTEDFYALSLDERGVIQSMMLERMATYNQISRLHQSGLLEPSEFNAMQGTVISILRTKGGSQWWACYKHMVPAPFENLVATALNNPAIAKKSYAEELPWLFSADTQAPLENGDNA